MLWNMKQQKLLTLGIILSLTACAAGCGKVHPPPPLERNSLILRFFNSMTIADAAAASEQGKKLRQMDHANDNIVKLITIQQSNAYLRRAQGEINAGNIEKAMEILNEGVKTYPDNRDLSRQRSRVRQLRNAKMLLDNMKGAKDSADMSAALTAASAGLASNMTPKLQAYFNAYKLKIDETAKQEAAKTAAPKPAVNPEEKSTSKESNAPSRKEAEKPASSEPAVNQEAKNASTKQ